MEASRDVEDTIRSMTGFGSGSRAGDDFQVSAEIRSVNHRYLKVSSSLPEELSWAQGRVDHQIRQKFARGSINATLVLEGTAPGRRLEIDAELLAHLYRRAQAVRDQVAPDETIHLTDLLHLEAIAQPTQEKLTTQEALPLIEGALDDAMVSLRNMREREGGFLRQEVERIMDSAMQKLSELEAGAPATNQQNQKRYREKLQDFLAGTGVEVEESDLVRELAILAEKADTTEELKRLRGHLEQYRDAVRCGGKVGRKLDFLAQEMFREASTMAAKVNHYDLARIVVDLKLDVDRLREQTQNIE